MSRTTGSPDRVRPCPILCIEMRQKQCDMSVIISEKLQTMETNHKENLFRSWSVIMLIMESNNLLKYQTYRHSISRDTSWTRARRQNIFNFWHEIFLTRWCTWLSWGSCLWRETEVSSSQVSTNCSSKPQNWVFTTTIITRLGFALSSQLSVI